MSCKKCKQKNCCSNRSCGDSSSAFSSSSNSSCNFSSLASDSSQTCYDSSKKPSSSSSSSNSSCPCSSGSSGSCDNCSTCQKNCCNPRKCRDYSASSVASDLSGNSSCSFSHLASDSSESCYDSGESSEEEENEKNEKNKKKKEPVKKVKLDNVIPSEIKKKKFTIELSKKQGHPFQEYIEGTQALWVNGKPGPILHLYPQIEYYFDIRCDETIILTMSPFGGEKAKTIPGGFESSKGIVKFEVCKETPRFFFYQSTEEKGIGGLIIVHN